MDDYIILDNTEVTVMDDKTSWSVPFTSQFHLYKVAGYGTTREARTHLSKTL